MDVVPEVAELLKHVQLRSNTRINKLAKHLEISVDYKTKGKDRLDKVFTTWVKTKGVEATRKKMIESLNVIKEYEVSNAYWEYLVSVEERKA